MARGRSPSRSLCLAHASVRALAGAPASAWVDDAAPGPRALPAAFYDRPTLDVARDLLGKLLLHDEPEGPTAGLIVEVEAYIGEADPACHAAAGPTPRNAPLYGPPGFSYLYLNYGVHVLVNAVTEREGFPAAVLIRALEPILGVERMRARRSRAGDRPAREAPPTRPAGGGQGDDDAIGDHDLCRGPGRLSRALGLSLSLNRVGLGGPRLVIADVGLAPRAIAWTTRVGISAGNDRAWRAHVTPSACVSGWRQGGRARRRTTGRRARQS